MLLWIMCKCTSGMGEEIINPFLSTYIYPIVSNQKLKENIKTLLEHPKKTTPEMLFIRIDNI